MQISCANLDKSERKNPAIMQSCNNKEIYKSITKNSEELQPCYANEGKEEEAKQPFYYVFFKFLFMLPYLIKDAYDFLTFKK